MAGRTARQYGAATADALNTVRAEAAVMPFTFACSDIDPNCPTRLVSDTDVELLDQIHKHVAEAHPELAQKKQTPEQIKKAIKPKV